MSSETEICNMAIGRIGGKRLNSLDTDTGVEAIHCRLHYPQTRDALLRSHYWRFASARASLSRDTATPDFEYDYQYILPNDFMRLKSVFSDNGTETENYRYSFAIEGQRLLTDDGSVDIRYIKKVTNTAEFDSLFIEVLVLELALKLVLPLTQDAKLQQTIFQELAAVMPRVRAMDRQETNTIGRLNRKPWVEARLQGGGTWRQDRV